MFVTKLFLTPLTSIVFFPTMDVNGAPALCLITDKGIFLCVHFLVNYSL